MNQVTVNPGNRTNGSAGILRKMTIGTRLVFGFVVLIVLLVGVSVFITLQAKMQAELTARLYRHPFAVSKAVLTIDALISKMHRSMKDVALSESDAELVVAIDAVDRYEREAYQMLSVIEERFLGDKKQVEALAGEFMAWKPIRDEVISLVRRDERGAAAAITRGKGAAHVARLATTMQALIDFAGNKAIELSEGAEAAARRSYISIAVFVFLSLAAGIMIAVVITRSITRPLASALILTEQLAAGDLAVDVSFDNVPDEVGQLTGSFGKMAEAWRSIVQKIKDSAARLSSSSAEIATASEQMSRSAASQSEQVIKTSSGMEEMSASIREVSRNAGNTSDAAAAASEMGRRGLQGLGNTLGGIAAANESIKKLSARSREIGKIVQLIGEIAAQTNILALNAAIEAARAGEHGRGFDVVAEEIRKLAMRTTQSTEEIAAIIEEIQTETQEAAEKMEEGTTMANDTGRNLEDIVEGIVSTTDMVQVISSSATQQAQTAEEIADALQSISSSSRQTSDASKEVARSTQDLTALAEQLREITGQFKF